MWWCHSVVGRADEGAKVLDQFGSSILVTPHVSVNIPKEIFYYIKWWIIVLGASPRKTVFLFHCPVGAWILMFLLSSAQILYLLSQPCWGLNHLHIVSLQTISNGY